MENIPQIRRKTPPQKRFWTPHLRYVSPPLSWRLSVISLKRKRHRPDQPQFLRPPKVGLESTLCSTFPPPPNSRDTLTKGRFCKEVVWRLCPRSGCWGPGVSKIITFFCQGNTAGKDFLEENLVQENICQNHPFGNHPSANPQMIAFYQAQHWLFAQKPFDPPNRPKPPPNPKISRKSGVAPKSPRNSHWIHTKRHTKPHWIPLSPTEFSRNFPNFPQIAQILPNPWNFQEIKGGEEFMQSATQH